MFLLDKFHSISDHSCYIIQNNKMSNMMPQQKKNLLWLLNVKDDDSFDIFISCKECNIIDIFETPTWGLLSKYVLPFTEIKPFNV